MASNFNENGLQYHRSPTSGLSSHGTFVSVKNLHAGLSTH